MARRPARGTNVGVLLMNGMWTHDVANTIQVFGNGTPIRGTVTCDFAFVAHRPHVRLDHGLSAEALPLGSVSGTYDLICVPGFVDPIADLDADEESYAACCDWLSDAHAMGAEVASLGTGAFVLAGAGLLDGLECTTHHAFADDFRRLFPNVRLTEGKILTHDATHRVWTSAGGASGLDLCLSLLAHLAGASAAAAVSEAMSLWRPHSIDARDNAFGMPANEAAAKRASDIDQICHAVAASLARPWSVAQMAQASGMSRRTFERHFVEATGETPKSWLDSQRFETASTFLVQTDLPMPVIASRVGLSSADVLYRLFVSRTGESPRAYRRRFSSM